MKPDPQNLPTVGTKPAKKSVKSTSRPVSLKKDVEPSPEQDRTSKGSLKPAAADAKTAPTQQPRLESSYRGRGRGSRRGDRAVIYRQSSGVSRTLRFVDPSHSKRALFFDPL